jgi:hypothetical protein
LVKISKGIPFLLLCLLLAACLQRDGSPQQDNGNGAVTENLDETAYPPPASPTIELAYPVLTPAVGETAVPAYPPPETSEELFLPHVGHAAPTDEAMTPTPRPTATATPIPPLDFEAIRADLLANGQELAYVKMGFHTGVGGNTEGLEEWMRRLDAAGIPFFLKTADNAEPVYIAQELRKKSGVPHTLVFRRSVGRQGTHVYDVPRYDLPPAEAARLHWELHLAEWPPELDPEIVWLETINEVDRNLANWLGEFALATAELALADGYRWAAFGWASGEPEPEHWQTPAMLQFLRLAGENPDRLAIALHEYSYVTDNIQRQYPYLLGRFQQLFQICDEYGIPRPTVLITEWGWTYQEVPEPEQAIADIAWASAMYAPYPEVKGAAIWYLGPGFGGIADLAQRLIEPLTVYTLRNYHTHPIPPAQAPIDPEQFRP